VVLQGDRSQQDGKIGSEDRIALGLGDAAPGKTDGGRAGGFEAECS